MNPMNLQNGRNTSHTPQQKTKPTWQNDGHHQPHQHCTRTKTCEKSTSPLWTKYHNKLIRNLLRTARCCTTTHQSGTSKNSNLAPQCLHKALNQNKHGDNMRNRKKIQLVKNDEAHLADKNAASIVDCNKDKSKNDKHGTTMGTYFAPHMRNWQPTTSAKCWLSNGICSQMQHHIKLQTWTTLQWTVQWHSTDYRIKPLLHEHFAMNRLWHLTTHIATTGPLFATRLIFDTIPHETVNSGSAFPQPRRNINAME